ncbi:hypothetical protein Tco_1248004 [Tanacetum coccineum]
MGRWQRIVLGLVLNVCLFVIVGCLVGKVKPGEFGRCKEGFVVVSVIGGADGMLVWCGMMWKDYEGLDGKRKLRRCELTMERSPVHPGCRGIDARGIGIAREKSNGRVVLGYGLEMLELSHRKGY